MFDSASTGFQVANSVALLKACDNPGGSFRRDLFAVIFSRGSAQILCKSFAVVLVCKPLFGFSIWLALDWIMNEELKEIAIRLRIGNSIGSSMSKSSMENRSRSGSLPETRSVENF